MTIPKATPESFQEALGVIDLQRTVIQALVRACDTVVLLDSKRLALQRDEGHKAQRSKEARHCRRALKIAAMLADIETDPRQGDLFGGTSGR